MSEVTAILAKGEPKDEGYDSDAALRQCMEDFAHGLLATPPNYDMMKHAFQGAFECLESQEHEEGE